MWKSMPTVGCIVGDVYVEPLFKPVADVFFDDGGLAYQLITQEDDLVLGPASPDRP